MSHSNGDPQNGNHNGRDQQFNMMHLMLLWKEIEAVLERFIRVDPEGEDAINRLMTWLADMPRKFDAIEVTVQKSIFEMASANRRLQDRETDRCVVIPFILILIQIIDRISREVAASEVGVEAKEFIDACRLADREELLAHLAGLGVEQFGAAVDKPLDVSRHTVKGVHPTSQAHRIGRVRTVLRPGYRRRTDSLVIRPVWVEIWIARKEPGNPAKV